MFSKTFGQFGVESKEGQKAMHETKARDNGNQLSLLCIRSFIITDKNLGSRVKELLGHA
jgi:hypothetical protein